MGDIRTLTTDPLNDKDGQAFIWQLFLCEVLDAEGWTDEMSESAAAACLVIRQVRGNGARLMRRYLRYVDGYPSYSYRIEPRHACDDTGNLWQHLRLVLMPHKDVIRKACDKLNACPRAAKWEADRYATVDGEKVDTDSGEVME